MKDRTQILFGDTGQDLYSNLSTKDERRGIVYVDRIGSTKEEKDDEADKKKERKEEKKEKEVSFFKKYKKHILFAKFTTSLLLILMSIFCIQYGFQYAQKVYYAKKAENILRDTKFSELVIQSKEDEIHNLYFRIKILENEVEEEKKNVVIQNEIFETTKKKFDFLEKK